MIRLLLISAFVVILNETIMGVAIPRLMASLGVDAVAAQWLTTAFLLTMAVVIPITGFLLQRLHTRTIFVAAMTLFCLGTLVATLAPGLPVLVIARVIQASGTAIMLPLLMTTVMTLVPAESRGKTMGNIMIVISVAPAIGPTISGLILSVLAWRWLFALVLPIAIAALLLGARRIENVTTPREAPLDFGSVLLSAVGFGGGVYGLSLIGTPAAPQSFPTWAPLAIGALGVVAFVTRQLILQRHDRALLDLRTFTSRNFTVSVVLMAIMMLGCAIEAMGEGFSLIRKYGVDPASFFDVMTDGLFAAPAYKVYGNIIAKELYAQAGFTTTLGLKDANLLMAAALAANVPLPSLSVYRDRLISAVANGQAEQDWSVIARVQARAAGIE